MNIVYLTTNLINGKKYVGSHSTDDINDGYLGSGRIFKKAIKKYGKENFEKEVLLECDTIEEARGQEKIFIEKFNTLIPEGYNFHVSGGPTNKGGFHSEETKRKMSESAKKRWRDKNERISQSKRLREMGLTHSEESRRKMKENHADVSGEKHPMFGKNHSEESKQKIRDKITGTKLSEETKQKISKNARSPKYWSGKKLSEEHKIKIGEGQKRNKK